MLYAGNRAVRSWKLKKKIEIWFKNFNSKSKLMLVFSFRNWSNFVFLEKKSRSFAQPWQNTFSKWKNEARFSGRSYKILLYPQFASSNDVLRSFNNVSCDWIRLQFLWPDSFWLSEIVDPKPQEPVCWLSDGTRMSTGIWAICTGNPHRRTANQ